MLQPSASPGPATSRIFSQRQAQCRGPGQLLLWVAEPGQEQGAFKVLSSLAHVWEPFAVEMIRTPKPFALATQHLHHAVDNVPHGPIIKTDSWVQSVNTCVALIYRASLLDAERVITIKPLLPPQRKEFLEWIIKFNLQPCCYSARISSYRTFVYSILLFSSNGPRQLLGI